MSAALQDVFFFFEDPHLHTVIPDEHFVKFTLVSVFNLFLLKMFYWDTTLSWRFLPSLFSSSRSTQTTGGPVYSFIVPQTTTDQ